MKFNLIIFCSLCLIILLWVLSISFPSVYGNQTVKSIEMLNLNVYPPIWSIHHLLQTLFIHIKTRDIIPYSHRKLLTLPDTQPIALDYFEPKCALDPKYTCICLHTINGNCFGAFEQSFIKSALNENIRVIIVNRRGYGDVPLVTPKFNIFGDVNDLTCAINYISNDLPNDNLTMIGISAGTSILMKYLGVVKNTPIKAAVCISPGYNLRECINITEPYNTKIVNQIKSGILCENKTILTSKDNYRNAYLASMKSKTLSELLSNCYVFSGYNSIDDYYQNTNPINDIKNISIPILTVSSFDDPICTYENTCNYSNLINNNNNGTTVITKTGGHCSFLQGFKGESWSDQLSLQYFNFILK